MYIGKPQRVFTVEPVEHPVQRKDAERRSEREASVSVVDVEKGRVPQVVRLSRDESR